MYVYTKIHVLDDKYKLHLKCSQNNFKKLK